MARVHRNEYKRRQAAPGLKVTTKAFGVGRRFPIAARATTGSREPRRAITAPLKLKGYWAGGVGAESRCRWQRVGVRGEPRRAMPPP